MNRDDLGIIGQKKPHGHPIPVEGGDSANWMGHWIYLNDGIDPGGKFVVNSRTFIICFEVGFGAYVRHPDVRKTKHGFGAYYRNPWDGCISRDQLIGIMAAIIAGREYAAMLRLILHHALRLFLFSYNTIDNGQDPKSKKRKWPDFTGPNIWATMLRGFGPLSWVLWPLLCVLDIHTLLNTIFHNMRKSQHVISFAMTYIIARENVPTPTSWLASKILDREELKRELKEYWCGWRDNCEIYNLYVPRL